MKFAWSQSSCDIPTPLAFQGNFSSNEHCTNVFTCFNLLLVCVRNLATEKNISRKGGSTEIIGIFALARNPLGTAEAGILTLLHDFPITCKPLKLQHVHQEGIVRKVFSPRIFWGIVDSFVA